MPLDVPAIRAQFPIFRRQINGNRLVFLDSAASSQKPQPVIDAMVQVWSNGYANVHRGLYSLAEEATEAYEGARVKVANFINAADPAEIINVRNATEGINLLVYTWGDQNIKPGDRIVVTELEHHANLVPWQQLARRKGAELAYIPVTDDGLLDMEALPQLLEDGRTKDVACSEHEQDIVAYAMERLSEMPRLRILGPGPKLRGGVVSFWMEDAHPHDIAAILNEDGICVRAGHHCAQPTHDRFGIPASARASFYIYNDKGDVDVLVAALHKVVRLLGRR